MEEFEGRRREWEEQEMYKEKSSTKQLIYMIIIIMMYVRHFTDVFYERTWSYTFIV